MKNKPDVSVDYFYEIRPKVRMVCCCETQKVQVLTAEPRATPITKPDQRLHLAQCFNSGISSIITFKVLII